MNNGSTPTTRDEILRSFQALQRAHAKAGERVISVAEEAERSRDAEVVERAADYTVESIVKGLADLQLGFAAELVTLSEQLEGESGKLTELSRAIVVEDQRAERLANIRVAAEALAFLSRENTDRAASFEENSASQRQSLDDEMKDRREGWSRDQAEFEADAAEFASRQQKDRTQQEEEFAYDTARERKLAGDAHAESERVQGREIAAEAAVREKDWSAREEVLTAAAAEIAGLRQKVDGFEAELDAAVDKARGDAMKKASSEAKVESELRSKGYEGDQRVFELQIEALQQTLVQQEGQLTNLLQQLEVATTKSQSLAVKAIEGSARVSA